MVFVAESLGQVEARYKAIIENHPGGVQPKTPCGLVGCIGYIDVNGAGVIRLCCQ